MEDTMKKDCFAFKRIKDNHGNMHYKCNALNDLYCSKEGVCSFYATKEQHINKMKERGL